MTAVEPGVEAPLRTDRERESVPGGERGAVGLEGEEEEVFPGIWKKKKKRISDGLKGVCE